MAPQIAEREEAKPLRKKINEIFKKGFTVTTVLLAVGATIRSIVSSLLLGPKAVANAVEKGLQELGKKIASILPGLLGAIASFEFKPTGKVICFLGENAWILILGCGGLLD